MKKEQLYIFFNIGSITVRARTAVKIPYRGWNFLVYVQPKEESEGTSSKGPSTAAPTQEEMSEEEYRNLWAQAKDEYSAERQSIAENQLEMLRKQSVHDPNAEAVKHND